MLRPLVVTTAAVVLLLTPRPAHAQTQAPAAPLPLPAAGSIPESVVTVPVHLKGAQGLSLEMQPLRADHSDDVDDDAWRPVCDAPCDRPLPTGGIYRITGPGTSDSDEFHLKGPRDQWAVLDVSPISNAQRRTGLGLIIGGSVVLGIGALITSVDALVIAVTGDSSSGALGVGLGGVVAGAAMLIVGVAIHPGTAVKQEPPVTTAPTPTPAPTYVAPAAVRLPAPSSTTLFTAVF